MPVRPTLSVARAALLACAALALLPHSAPRAADWGPGTMVAPSAGEAMMARTINLAVGKSVIIDLPRDAKEVFVANPAVANAVVRSARKIFLIGQAAGSTSVFVFDAQGRQIASLDIAVGRDLAALRETLRRAVPNATIDVQAAGDSILLVGSVASAADAQRAVDIANAFVGAAEGTRGAVVNSLSIGAKEQVMLRVTVVEVARSVLKNFGITTTAGWTAISGNGMNLTMRGAPVDPLNPRSTVTATLSAGGFNVSSTLDAFESAGISRVLAEPTLVAISGETADFNAGGEIPLRTCTGTGADRSCAVELLQIGVQLQFTPVVLSNGRISLRVATRVRELDSANSINFEGTRFPGFKTRESATSLELASGATIMTAGLLSQTSGQTISGLPGLMNLPILGSLFRSRDYQRQETELMILVTPVIAQAMQPTQVARPDDNFVDSFDPQAVLLGRLNRLYGTAANTDPVGLRGTFGFIAD